MWPRWGKCPYEWKNFKELDITSVKLDDNKFIGNEFSNKKTAIDILAAIEKEWREPVRPLGSLSDFVVEVLPKLLDTDESLAEWWRRRIDETELEELRRTALSEIECLYTDYFSAKKEKIALIEKNNDWSVFDNKTFAQEFFWENLELAMYDLWMIQNVLRYKKWKHIIDSIKVPLSDFNKEYNYLLQLDPVYDTLEEPLCLWVLINELSNINERVPQITYEDLIFVNPLHKDPRLFFDWKTGNAEYLFYYWHGLIEKHFNTIWEELFTILEEVDAWNFDVQSIKQKVTLLKDKWDECLNLLWTYHTMLRKHFSIFRELFLSKPHLWLRWASWAFSAWMPIFDLLTWLNTLDTAQNWYLDRNLKYYPKQWQELIKKARKMFVENKTVESFWKSKNLECLMELYDVMTESILTFRKMHGRTHKK